MLATLARESRLTLVYGTRDCGMTTLLKTGILPSLGRRRSDSARSLPANGMGGAPMPDRRSNDSAANRKFELPIYVGAWNRASSAYLQERILISLSRVGIYTTFAKASLVTNLLSWSKQFNVRFVVIFDRFEEYLMAPFDNRGIREFAEQWVRILAHPALPVNFLICVRNDARPLMDRFAQRVSGICEDDLSLPRLWDANFVVVTKHEDIYPANLPHSQSAAASKNQYERVERLRSRPKRPISSVTKRSGAWRMVLVAVALLALAAFAEFERQSDGTPRLLKSTGSIGAASLNLAPVAQPTQQTTR